VKITGVTAELAESAEMRDQFSFTLTVAEKCPEDTQELFSIVEPALGFAFA
jgi:hypothetical protein